MSDLSEAIGDDSIAPTPYATAAMSRSPSSQSYTNIQALGEEAEPMHIDREGVQKKAESRPGHVRHRVSCRICRSRWDSVRGCEECAA